MPQQRHLVDELIERARQLKLVNPYVLHGDKILRAFDARHLPIVLVDSDGKLRYLNDSDVLRALTFDAADSITISTLRAGVICPVNIFVLFESVLHKYGFATEHDIFGSLLDKTASSTRVEGVQFAYTVGPLDPLDAAFAGEAIYHLGSFLSTYERYFKHQHEAAQDVKAISDAALNAVPIYVFGIPRALVVCPHIAQRELNMMMSTITMGLERLLWDVFTLKTAECIRDKMTVSRAIAENLDVLLPVCDWKSLGFPLQQRNVDIGEAVTLPVDFPIVHSNLASDLETQQESLCYRIKSYAGTWYSLREAILAEAMTASITKVMTRNGSHNLGSHALGHLAGYFDEKTEAGGALVPGYENGIGKFLRYIQKRMDFMTQIATAPPTWCLSLPWTGGAGAFGSYGVLTDFEKQYCLLDTITRSDNVRLGEDGVRKTGTSQLLFETPINPIENQVSQVPSQPVFVGVPHGQIGAHALYSILENLLRNAAKYGKERGENPLRMTVAMNEAWESVAPEARRADWLNEYFQITVSDSNDTEEAVKNDINNFLKNPILDRETAELLTGQWGIKEIKICAAYLRMIRQEEIDFSFDLWRDEREGAQPPIVEARLLNPHSVSKIVVDVQGNELLDENGDEILESKTIGQLAYVFYVLQPKEALVIGSSLSDSLSEEERAEFQRAGLDFRSLPELQERVRRRGQPLRHQFAVLHARTLNVEAWRWLAGHVSSLPCRLMVCGVSALEDVPFEVRGALEKAVMFQSEEPSFQTPDAWRRWLWETWVVGRHPDLELVARWEVPSKASAPGIVTFVDQDDTATRELERRNALTYDHCDSPDKGGEPDSPGEVLYTSSQFHESIGGTHPAREIFKKAQDEMVQRGTLDTPTLATLMQLKEAAAVKIAVLDERIFDRRHDAASGTGTKYLKNSKFGKAWAKRRVYLLNHEQAEKSFKTLPLEGLEEGEQYDVLVVHQGIIDKLRDKLKQSPQEYEEGWRRLKERARFVVVDTGRGKPDTARDEGLRWLEYSNLSEAVFRGSKLDVVSLLFALRADADTTPDSSHSLTPNGSPNLTEAG